MTEREKFILDFIRKFYQKSKRKRRSSKNQAHYIARTINNVCKSYFHRRLQFSEEEIYRAFKKNRFSLMESDEKDFSWERFHKGHILVQCHLFINIDVQSNADLKLAMKRTYPPNFKPETVDKIDRLKTELNVFWEKRKHSFSEFND